MRVMPASHEAHTRRPRKKRPKNTALGPCLAKKTSPSLSAFARLAW